MSSLQLTVYTASMHWHQVDFFTKKIKISNKIFKDLNMIKTPVLLCPLSAQLKNNGHKPWPIQKVMGSLEKVMRKS